MLVLTRKIGESIKIDDNIKITVVDIKGGNIRLGIEAPRNARIFREEIFLKIREENQSAASLAELDFSKLGNLVSKNVKP